VEAAKKSGMFDKIIVSTDDPEIGEIAKTYGAEVPFLRPVDISDDYTPAHKAARHALEWAIAAWGPVESFGHIYPTAPLLSAETLKRAMAAVTEGGYGAAWAMTRIPYPVYQLMARTERGLERLFPEDKAAMRSQDMPPAFIDVGQAYCFDSVYFLEHELAVGPSVAVIEVSPESAMDIDTEEDWLKAEKIAATNRETELE
jgi:N-acylneuraminate cytidylyltransferase